MLIASVRAPLVHADQPAISILSVDHPQIVRPGTWFTVTLHVAYSARYGMIDIGIWNIQNGTVLQEVVSNASLNGPGMSTYALNVQAPRLTLTWRLAAMTRAWIQDAWYFDQSGEYDFSVNITDRAFVQVNDLQSNFSLTFDGNNNTSNGPTILLPTTVGPHILKVPSIIAAGTGRRLVFTGWSDGVSSNPRTIILSDNLSIAPIYRVQYFLNVSSQLGRAEGAGWYWAGSTAWFGVGPPMQSVTGLLAFPVGEYSFTGWSGSSNSTTPITSIQLNGPAEITADWSYQPTGLNPAEFATIAFILASTILFLRAIFLSSRRNRKVLLRNKVATIILFLLIPVMAVPANAMAAVPTPTNAVSVNIGDASWYYWPDPSSNTCVLWLGGGLEVAQGGYLINPFEYESFGTIRFLQDLSKYYCLLVLQHGSSPSHDFADRTIFQEPIQGQPTIAREAHDWLTGQGYGHIVLMGYSVGAEAAAAIAVSDPGEWTGKDGLILITARLPPNLAGESPVLNTNLMLLYGHAPTFEPSGQRFYQLAPAEGWHGTEYLHKEYHVLDQMSHEVWSPLANNTYSPQLALGTIVNFIQTFIALQFGRISLTTTKASYTIESVQSPQTVMTGAPFIVDAQLSELNTTSTQGSRYALVALLNATVTLTSVELPNPTRTEVQLLVPPIPNASRTQLAVLVVTNIGNQWIPASSAYPIAVTATNDIELTINGLIGNTTLKLDNSKYDVPNDGTLTLNTTVGNHMIQTLTGSHESSVEYAFVEWNDGNTSATRILTLTHDTTLTVTYHTQYFVNVTSPFGVPEGAGWYDTNSTIIPTLAALPQPTDLFQYWSTAIGNYPSGAPIQVNSPMTVNAIWAENSSSYSPGNSWLPVSILAFLFMLLINRKLSRARKSV